MISVSAVKIDKHNYDFQYNITDKTNWKLVISETLYQSEFNISNVSKQNKTLLEIFEIYLLATCKNRFSYFYFIDTYIKQLIP